MRPKGCSHCLRSGSCRPEEIAVNCLDEVNEKLWVLSWSDQIAKLAETLILRDFYDHGVLSLEAIKKIAFEIGETKHFNLEMVENHCSAFIKRS